jgi:hypothetical protein
MVRSFLVPHSPCRSQPRTGPGHLTSFSFALMLAGYERPLVLFSKPSPRVGGRLSRRQTSGNPTLFAPSLKVERDSAHYPPPILLLGLSTRSKP